MERAVLIFITVLCCLIAQVNAEFCNGTSYNISTHLCCGNTLSEHTNVTQTAHPGIVGCCGEKPYVATMELCCGMNPPRLFPRQTPQHICCGPENTYNRVTHLCCQDKVIEKPDLYQLYGCCGDRLLSYRSHLCCAKHLQPKPRTLGIYSCCDTQIMDNRFSLCCSGFVKPRPAYRPRDWHCCGSEAFSIKSHMCCNSKVQIRPGCFSGCCDSSSYDKETHLCCGGVLSRLPAYNNHMFYCCGQQAYDVNKHICCAGTLSEYADNIECCSNQTYNSTSEICCAGLVYPRSHETYTVCCNGDPYDVRESKCCWPHLKPRSFGENTRCCGQEVFNDLTHVCCRGVVRTIDDFKIGYC